MAAPCVEATITLKSGKQHTIRYEIDSNDGANYKQFRENLKKLQGDVNARLTEEVEREKADNKQSGDGKQQHTINTDSGEDENEDDDDIDSETNNETRNKTNEQDKEPPSKKQKT